MCDPMTMAAVALSAGGQYMNTQDAAKNQNRMISARNAAAEAESVRQKAFQAEADAAYRPSVERYKGSSQEKDLTDARTYREGRTQGAVRESKAYAPSAAGGQPNVVKSELARKMHDAVTGARKEAKSLGRLSSWGDLTRGNQVALSRNRDAIGEAATNAGRSAALLPLDQQAAANNAYKGSSGFGDMLQLAGTAAGMYGMAGGGPTWGQLGFGRAPTVGTPLDPKFQAFPTMVG